MGRVRPGLQPHGTSLSQATLVPDRAGHRQLRDLPGLCLHHLQVRASPGSVHPAGPASLHFPDFSTGCEVGAGVVAEPVPMGTRGGYHVQTTLGCLDCHLAWICPFLPAGSSSCSRDQPG